MLSKFMEIYLFSQVSKSPFIAVIADETTEVSVQNNLSIGFKYVHECKVVESILDVFQPKRVKAEGIADVILSELAIILKCVRAK